LISLQLYKTLNTADGDLPLDVNLTIKNGEFITIEGPSGAGKTTILRMIAGLLKPEKGHIKVDDALWEDTETGYYLPPQKRKVGVVFQDYSLFPNMTIEQNLVFALGDKNGADYVKEVIGIMELEALKERYPQNLSGGQKQRAALARAIVRKPEMLLLDEPLSALDAEMRLKLQDYILKVHRKFKLTTILVSHSISEIFKMSDRVIRLNKGKIIHEGSATDVYAKNYISGKFRFTGEVVGIERDDVVYIVNVLVGNNIIKVIETGNPTEPLKTGGKVMIVSKAFNPLIIKIGD
jgi:molybdate transport system ATP-binding protein